MWKCLWCVTLLFTSACVSVTSTTTYSQTRRTERTSKETVQDSLRYHVTASVEGPTLVVSLTSEETCRFSIVPVYRKVRYDVHDLDPTSDKNKEVLAGLLMTGTLFLAAGAYVYANADAIAARPPDPGDTPTTPGGVRDTGLIVGAIRIPLLAAGVVDLVRLTDTHDDVGDVDGEATVTTLKRHERVVSNQQLTLTSELLPWRANAGQTHLISVGKGHEYLGKKVVAPSGLEAPVLDADLGRRVA